MTESRERFSKAVFLDRDGVLNHAVVRNGIPYPPENLEEFRLYPEVPEACRLLVNAGFLLIVATNQPDVERGIQKKSVVEAMHANLTRLLPLTDIEVCYDSGNEKASDFRKPAPGMLLRAAKKWNICLSNSFMIGDRWRDVDCGHSAGCKTIFIQRGYQESLKKKPDHQVSNLLEAAILILKEMSGSPDLS